MSKKLVSAALAATTLLWAVGGVALFAPVANAQTTASLQAQIQQLLAQIAQLQTQMGTSSSQTTTTSSYSFSKDLTLGSKGADVNALQQLLISKGYLTVVSAPTGYFGAATQKALAAWQSANGISPAAGYFGPKTRAFVNSMSVGSSSTTTTTTTGGQTTTTQTTQTTTTGTTVVAPATGVAVSLAAANPGAGTLVSSSGSGSGAARVPVLTVNFTAGNSGAATVSEVKFHKIGVLSDSSVSGAYLTQNGKVLYQYNSLSSGILDFSGMSLNIPAGQTVTLTLAIDVSGGLNSGNTTSFSLNSASDVSAWDSSNNALTASGTFPLNGSLFTVTQVSNPNLATLALTSSGAVGGTVTAGTQGNLVYASTYNVSNSKVYLEGINFHVVGSANKGDIRNVKLVVNGTQVGATLPTVNQDGTAYFDASAAPGVLNTGNNNVQVFADVMGSPSYTFQFEILNGYDVLALDSQYSIPVKSNSDGGKLVTIQQGQITVTQDSATPSGTSLSKGQSSVALAKFDIYAAGEAVKVLYLPFQITFNVGTTTLSNFIQNVSITDDAGGQVGTTINLPGSASDPMGTGSYTANAVTYNSSFGTSNSPINYTIPANTTRVLTLKADIQPNASFSTIQAGLVAPGTGATNLQGMVSSQLSASTAVTGNTLTLSSSEVTVTQDSSLGAQTLAANSTGQKISSFAFTASQSEGVTVSNLTIQVLSAAGSTNLANLKVMVNGTQFGTTQPTVNGNLTNPNVSFSGTPFTVPAGGTVVVGVYADVLSGAVLSGVPVVSLVNFSGTGATSFTAVSNANGTINGQSLKVSTNGSAITASINSSYQPANGQLSMGTTGNVLASLNFNETSNTENVKLTSLDLVDVTPSATNTVPSFSNLTLWNGTQEVGSVQSFTATTTVGPSSTPAFLYAFTNLLSNSLGTAYVPRNGVLSLTLKGDVNNFTTGNAADLSSHTFEIATTTTSGAQATSSIIVAQGATSGKAATITLPPLVSFSSTTAPITGATQQTVLQNALVFSSTPVGLVSGRGKSTNDEIADLTFNAANGGSLLLNNATVTFQGSAASTTLNFIQRVKLLDPSGNPVATSSITSNCGVATSTCSVTFNFNNRLVNGAQTYKLTVDDSQEQIATGNNSVSLYATIAVNTDVAYTDAASGGTATTLPSILQPGNQIFPLNLNSVTYSQGT
jgi:hypothetical protein